MKKVLIVEDDKEYVKFVKKILLNNCEVDHIETKADLLAACMSGELRKYSVILFDLFLEHDNGISLFQKVRSLLGDQMPLSILISERATHSQRLQVFESYFFDFINKDYKDEEIKLRIMNALHYSREFKGHLAADGLLFDLESQKVTIDREQPNLTQIEFKIFYNCANNPRGIRKDLLMKNVWDDQLVLGQTLNVHIHNLNKKIESMNRNVAISGSGIVTYSRID